MTKPQPPIPPNTFELTLEIRTPDNQVTGAQLLVTEEQLIEYGPKQMLLEGFRRLAAKTINHVVPDEDDLSLKGLSTEHLVNINPSNLSKPKPIWQSPVGAAPALDPNVLLEEEARKEKNNGI